MKGGGKIIGGIGAGVVFLLLYVHQYFLLFQTSYRLDHKQHSLNQKTENFRRLKFEVDQLKAPRLLEEHMRDLALDLSLPREINIVKIPSVEVRVPLKVHSVMPQPWTGRIMNWVGRWVDVAQAKENN